MDRPVIDVVQRDLLQFPADVAVLKYADRFWGVDAVVYRELDAARAIAASFAVASGEHLLVEARGAISARHVLFVGVGPLYEFRYGAIRAMAERSLAILQQELPTAVHMSTPIHGPGYGLDEVEAV